MLEFVFVQMVPYVKILKMPAPRYRKKETKISTCIMKNSEINVYLFKEKYAVLNIR